MMNLEWQEEKSASQQETGVGSSVAFNYFADCPSDDDVVIRSAIGESVEKAVALIGQNIRDDSMYFLCGWDISTSTLSIVVSDETRKQDSPSAVSCTVSALAERFDSSSEQAIEYASNIQYWVRDYLTTCGGFMSFSLVAVFYRDSRARVDLL